MYCSRFATSSARRSASDCAPRHEPRLQAREAAETHLQPDIARNAVHLARLPSCGRGIAVNLRDPAQVTYDVSGAQRDNCSQHSPVQVLLVRTDDTHRRAVCEQRRADH